MKRKSDGDSKDSKKRKIDYVKEMEKIGIKIPKLLLPNPKLVDFPNWVTTACDQYTSDIDFWIKVMTERKEKASTLWLMLPEIFLLDKFSSHQSKFGNINKKMDEYMNNGVFVEEECFVYLERKLSDGTTRKGLMMTIDLEKYSYEVGTQPLIRPTERTIPERIPPRLKIRKDAPIEMPHILVLIDDPEKTVIEPLAEGLSDKDIIYNFDFDVHGEKTHLKGYKVADKKLVNQITQALMKLGDKKLQKTKYNLKTEKESLLFAVGDGNHSLGTAKMHWEKVKESGVDIENHPARYALVEIISLFDESIDVFLPIHRLLEWDSKEVLDAMDVYFKEQGVEVKTFAIKNEKGMLDKKKEYKGKGHFLYFYYGERCGYCYVKTPKVVLEVASLQNFLNWFLDDKIAKKLIVEYDKVLDYIHGDKKAKADGLQKGHMSFLLPCVDKTKLFESVIKTGCCPRKTFSIGHAHDKRVYFECRKIRK